MTATPALRVCTPYVDADAGRCPHPACRIEQCAKCLREVHFHPGASIAALGPEVIVCPGCVPLEEFISRQDGSWIGRPFTGAQDPAFGIRPEAQN